VVRLSALAMSEGDLQANVLDTVRTLGGLAYHTHDSRKSAQGFPDLVIVFPRTGALLFAELKSDTGSATPEQLQWLRALRRGERTAVREVYLWRPDDWRSGHIVETLTRCAREVIR
jgi:hypothetical protein